MSNLGALAKPGICKTWHKCVKDLRQVRNWFVTRRNCGRSSSCVVHCVFVSIFRLLALCVQLTWKGKRPDKSSSAGRRRVGPSIRINQRGRHRDAKLTPFDVAESALVPVRLGTTAIFETEAISL